jgi:hypothetical protein
MAEEAELEEKGRRERSPSFPFISLQKALKRAREVADAHKRNPARLITVAETWGYAPKSSGLQQTVSALKAFGLLDDTGVGDGRRVQISDLAWRILHDTRDGVKAQAVKEAALKPRLIAEYALLWLPARPSDGHCISELHLDRGFSADAARTFLKVFDETALFANLVDNDNISPNQIEDANSPPSSHYNLEAETGNYNVSGADARRGASFLPKKPLLPSSSRRQAARATLPLAEGEAALEIPAELSPRSYKALKAWVELMVQLAEPEKSAETN